MLVLSLPWLIIEDYWAENYNALVRIVLLAISNLVVFVLLIWRNTRVLSVICSKRQQAEQELRTLQAELEQRVIKQTEALTRANTELKQAESQVYLLRTIMLEIGESQDFDEALGAVLRQVCETKGFNYGEAWIPDPDLKVLKCSPAWYSNANGLETFRKISEGFTFASGIGLAGRVWLSKQPEWHQDVSQESELIFLHARMVMAAGLRAGLGIPVIANNQVLAVLVFFMSEACDEYKQLVDTISAVATQLGAVIWRKQLEGQLLHNAFHDALTGLPNRVLLMERLSQAIERAKQDENYTFAVLFLDLDRFKLVNDSLGHIIGDQLLIAFAHRLKACMRPGDIVARLGGDEFTILLENIQDVGDATQVADRIQRQLTLPFNINGHEVFTTASIGIAVSTLGYDRPEDLLRDADTTMYRAKAQPGTMVRYQVFEPTMHTQAKALLQLETDLRLAVERQEFQLYYQPIVSLSTDRITGFEALVRWRHPQRGLVSPDEFIPVAEETGLIIPIGWWVLREACRQMRAWHVQFSLDPPLTISVNVSGKQFSQPDSIERLAQILQETGLDVRSLKLEITESVLMDNAESAAAMLLQLQALGLRVAMDDFGTGYSSLSYLHRLPIDTLKIDRSFINGVDVDLEKIQIIRTVIALAWNLGMDVVAEGVATWQQMYQLKALKCEFGQGYFFSKPLDSSAAAALIAVRIQMPAKARSHKPR